MAGRLDGKVALITGGASGIGLGTVELFVAEGAKVVAADIQDEKGAMLEKRFPGQVAYAHCDVTSEAEIEAALQKAKTEFGGLDILFNNAGISDRMTSIGEITADGWSWIFDILVRGPALGMKHAVPLMLERGGGSIINTASIAGKVGFPGLCHYSASKFGVIGMTNAIAKEVAKEGITVNALCPGIVGTGMWRGETGLSGKWALPGETEEQSWERHQKIFLPQGEAQTPEDMGQMVVYLASAPHVTGQALAVDGGFSL